MPVCQLPPEQLRIGQPMPFGLRDAAGQLLMARGTVIETAALRQQLLARGVYVDRQDSEAYQRSLADKLDAMLRKNELLGRIAKAEPSAEEIESAQPPPRRLADPVAAFADLQMHADKLLREPPQPGFEQRLRKVQDELFALVVDQPDTALLLLVHATATEVHQYSATHAMLVTVVSDLALAHLPACDAQWRQALRNAALTMNMAMTALQDALVQQPAAPSAQQRAQIESHAERAAVALLEAGVDDALWLAAVRHHHAAPPEPLDALPPAMRLARLIRRADIFAARLAPRARRGALSGAAAARAVYLDERQQADECGSAIVRATGIYPPGSYVRLACGETALVLRRGLRANEPLVASVVGRAGTPLGEPALRNTRLPQLAVTAGVAPQDLRLRLNLSRLLRLI